MKFFHFAIGQWLLLYFWQEFEDIHISIPKRLNDLSTVKGFDFTNKKRLLCRFNDLTLAFL